jgi:hypothetical protein
MCKIADHSKYTGIYQLTKFLVVIFIIFERDTTNLTAFVENINKVKNQPIQP